MNIMDITKIAKRKAKIYQRIADLQHISECNTFLQPYKNCPRCIAMVNLGLRRWEGSK